MKLLNKIVAVLLVSAMISLSSCQKAEDLTAQVNEMEFVGDLHKLNGPIDEWLHTHVTLPYNIRVQWRWDRSETDLDRNITPIKEDKVIPAAQMLVKYYLEPYAAEAGELFIKRYPPKLYFLIGSASYNTNGTMRLGSADAGRKVSLYNLNNVDFSEYNSSVERVLKTVHHEFAHILDQNRRVTPEYGLISQQVHYVEDQWNTVYSGSNTLHLDRGFITPYAGSQPSEDFVEVVATLLAFGQAWFDTEVSKASPEGRDILRQKEGLVVDYFKASWGIEFRSLQQHIADAKPAQPNPPLINFLGEGKEYNYVELNGANIAPSSLALWTTFNEESVSESDRVLSSYRLSPLSDGSLMIRVARFAAGAGTTGSATFARIFFTMTNNADGTVSFTYSQPGTDPYASNTGGTQTALRNVSDGLIAFMEGNKFVWDWETDDMEGGSLWVVDENGAKTGQALTGSFGNY